MAIASPTLFMLVPILVEALAGTQKLISFMTDIDVRASVELEALVPVTLTDEEKLAIVAEQKALGEAALARVAEIEAAGVFDEAFMEKILIGADMLTNMLAELTVVVETGDITTQVKLGEEIAMMAADVDTLSKPLSEESEDSESAAIEIDEEGSAENEGVSTPTESQEEEIEGGRETGDEETPTATTEEVAVEEPAETVTEESADTSPHTEDEDTIEVNTEETEAEQFDDTVPGAQ